MLIVLIDDCGFGAAGTFGGKDEGSPVSPDYGPRGNEFNGTVNWVQIDLGWIITII